MKRFLIFLFCVSVLAGCAQPKEKVIIIKQNQFFRCETDKAIRMKMVNLINKARLKKRYCGSKPCPPARSIRWNPRLAQAALKHSRDMAKNDFFDHTGSNGKTVVERVNSIGYGWRAVGENIFAGHESSDDVVAGWLASAGHCQNIMSPGFTEIGAACFCNPDSDYGTYWTLVLASPK
ncbi:MAG: CAP domain-containing protein [Desulfobacterales bacterium]|nr:MAG: CAP domain-containing protein [Desulfobacterales bacterium]